MNLMVSHDTRLIAPSTHRHSIVGTQYEDRMKLSLIPVHGTIANRVSRFADISRRTSFRFVEATCGASLPVRGIGKHFGLFTLCPLKDPMQFCYEYNQGQ